MIWDTCIAGFGWLLLLVGPCVSGFGLGLGLGWSGVYVLGISGDGEGSTGAGEGDGTVPAIASNTATQLVMLPGSRKTFSPVAGPFKKPSEMS
jgi:hypothetical protein